MKKMLNTLYITKQETYLHKERETIIIKNGKEKVGQFPIINISNIFCFGNVSISPFLMGHCGENGVGLAFYTQYGKFLARVQGKQTGNVVLRRTQYRWADDKEKSVSIAKLIIAAKIANSRTVLMRELRNHGENAAIEQAVKKLAINLRQIKAKQAIPDILGVEGDAASSYFAVFNNLLRHDDFNFKTRNRRPATDEVNALLSFAYTLITHECSSALQGVGIDSYVGFLHQDRPGRQSLALDLLEEFRAWWADRFVLTLLNRKQLKKKDFDIQSSGAVRLTDKGRKVFLTAWQERKQVEIMHPYLNEKVPIGMLPHVQSLLLSRHLRGDTKYYPPFLVK